MRWIGLLVMLIVIGGCEPQLPASERAPAGQEDSVRCAFARDAEACKRLGVERP